MNDGVGGAIYAKILQARDRAIEENEQAPRGMRVMSRNQAIQTTQKIRQTSRTPTGFTKPRPLSGSISESILNAIKELKPDYENDVDRILHQ